MEVETAVGEERGGDVGRAFFVFPEDGRGVGQVAGAAEADGEEGCAAEAADGVEDAVLHDGSGDDVSGHAAAGPDFLAGLEVVGADAVRGGDDDLLAAVMGDDERGGPCGFLFAFGAPEFGAGEFVEGGDEVIAFVVPIDDDGVAAEGWGGAFAEGVAGLHAAEVFGPDDLSFHVEAVEPAAAEPCVDVGAVGDWGV